MKMIYTVYTTLNHAYVKLGASLIASIWENFSGDIQVKILDTGLTRKDKSKLLSWAQKMNKSLEIILVNENVFSQFFTFPKFFSDKIPYYARLLIPYFSKSDDQKVLYLDADIICVSDFIEVFSLQLGDKIVACCQDRNFINFSSKISTKTSRSIINNYSDFGFTGNELYFNSGVLLIDVQNWIKSDISKLVLKISVENMSDVFLWDQYALNIVLNGNWIRLDNSWNETKSIDTLNTKFRHYIKSKPINFGYEYDDREIFFKYLDSSPWKGWRPSFFSHVYKKTLRKLKQF
jgi:lipopolysaccharide biosynthesis glycosyltransferase